MAENTNVEWVHWHKDNPLPIHVYTERCGICGMEPPKPADAVEWDIDANLPLYTRDYLKQSGYLKRGIIVGYKIGDTVYKPEDVTIIREEGCPTCQGRVWSVKLGKWINTRETVDMICQTCGHNFLEE